MKSVFPSQLLSRNGLHCFPAEHFFYRVLKPPGASVDLLAPIVVPALTALPASNTNTEHDLSKRYKQSKTLFINMLTVVLIN